MELALELRDCESGETLPLLAAGVKSCGHRLLGGAMPDSVGTVLFSEAGQQLFLVTGFVWLQNHNGTAAKCALLTAQENIEGCASKALRGQKTGYSAAIVTLSDKGAAGQRDDTAGSQAAAMLKNTLQINYIGRFILPDNYSQLRALLLDLAQNYDLICTCGGTGLGPRDVTPQATKSVIDLELPGFAEAMRAASLAKTPNAVISRAVCGAIGKCLVLNLPGSRRAVEENLAVILPALEHAVRKLQGDPEDCGG